MRKSRIIRPDDTPVVDRGGGVSTNRLVTSELGARAFISGITTFSPNSGLALHAHNVDESVTVIEGEARCDVDGESYRLRPWDTTFVPAGTPHRFVNETGQRTRILFVYGGVDVARTILEPGG
ncbi:MAG TPA: cupin domain-containing protein, partial [Chloroflexota bacterium]